jgi:hypothetical protein
MSVLEDINPFWILAQSVKRIEQMLETLVGNTDWHNQLAAGQQPEAMGVEDAAKFLGVK